MNSIFLRCHATQILKIPNNLECFTAGLNSSIHQLALWSVLHAWLPWARCGVCNDLVPAMLQKQDMQE